MNDTASILDALGRPCRSSSVLRSSGRKKGMRIGLVIVDEVNGFATVGAGYLAPPVENAQVTHMVAETDRLAREFTRRDWPIFAFLDTHIPGKAEPPYPPHCEAGTGQEHLVPDLQWLEKDREHHAGAQGLHQRFRRRDRAGRVQPPWIGSTATSWSESWWSASAPISASWISC